MIFTAVVSPRHNMLSLSCALFWLWLHLFQFNVSNQSYSVHEDVLNKPWRPVPSGRISMKECRALRWGLMVFCLSFSSLFSLNVAMTSGVFTMFLVMHEDFHLSHHPIFKNLCNAGGYAANELGSLLILYIYSSKGIFTRRNEHKCTFLQRVVILLTIHAQDFADVIGDRMSGRRSLPIVAPKGSRIYMLCALPLFSFALGLFWSLGPFSTVLFVSMGSWVGIRYFFFRDEMSDQSSYRLYNVCIFYSLSVA
ncbi:UbiA prenyltransferase family [Suillus spraguei]|nr:UbiA prenyltransferase family [Suillus spraguei]